MTARVTTVGVVVPARDEEVLLPHALAALQAAAHRARGVGLSVDVLVVADACVDDTARVARSAGVRVLEIAAGSVGVARAAGLRDVLLGAVGVPRNQLWLASTDADSRVPGDWLTRQIELADNGADLVAGTVEVDDWTGHEAQVESRWRAAYDPRDGHGHVHGANVGARADAYLEVGGFAALDRDEDVALVAALAHRRVVRTGAIPVVTSSRQRPRAMGGFGDHLLGLA